MKTISLVQPNFQQGPKEFNAHYLPYSVGVLWSYVQTSAKVRDNYELDQLIWLRGNVEEALESIRNNDVVAFSAYVWNKNYNYALARRLKEVNPGCTIIFGGPELPITKQDIFERFPFIDIVVKGEGEITFKNVLESLIDNAPLDDIKGLLLNKNLEAVDTGQAERIESLEDIPSPYLTGVFDKLIAETKGVEWNATLETNRGCPYACTFCDWGSLTYNKVKKFDLERVFAELEWIGKNKCGFVSITDANFGMFVERDNAIADKLLEVQEKYGYPYTFSVAWAKNQKAEVFDIVFKLIKSPKFNQGLTVSVQSMDLDVLENIKRKNLDQHKIADIFALCDKNNVPVYTEIILGLPGESKQSWKENFWKLFNAGNHTGVTILHAQMLENAEMNLLQKKLYGITSIPVYDYMSGSYNYDELQESVEAVTSTKDMPFEDMLDSQVFSWYINTFHINGLTTYISRFLNKQNGVSYADFYDKLYNFLCTDPWFIKERDELRQYYKNWMTDGRINHPNISNIEVHGWNIVHRATLNIHAHRKYDYVFGLIEQFVKTTFNFDTTLINELILFQKHFVINYDNIHKYPIIEDFSFDFLGYLQDDTNLNNPIDYKFEFNEDKDITIERFLENIYFSRRRNFGKATITKIEKVKILNNQIPLIFTYNSQEPRIEWIPPGPTCTAGLSALQLHKFPDKLWYTFFSCDRSFKIYNIQDLVEPHVLEQIQNKTAVLVLDNAMEPYYEIIDTIYNYIVIKENIPASQIIFLTNMYDADEYSKKLAKKLQQDPIRILWFSALERDAQRHVNNIFDNNLPKTLTPKIYNKKFLNFNRRWRMHRPLMTTLLYHENLIEQGLISFGPCEGGNWDTAWPTLRHMSKDNELLSNILESSKGVTQLPPLYLDTTNLDINRAIPNTDPNWCYEDTYFSLISETTYFNSNTQMNSRFITEKTFHAISMQHPFILITIPNSLDVLKELGYKTFSPWIDESYDKELDDAKRMLMIVEETKRLCNLSSEQLADFLVAMKEICLYNFNNLMSKRTFIVEQ